MLPGEPAYRLARIPSFVPDVAPTAYSAVLQIWLLRRAGEPDRFTSNHQKLIKEMAGIPPFFIKLPLVNAFKNREIEFGFSLQNIQTVFDTFGIQPAYAPT